MPIYEYRCEECGEVFSRLTMTFASADGQHCVACGSEQTRRLMSSFAIGGRANPGPGRAAWPTSWDDTNGGDPETLSYWRKRIEREAKLEEKYPELRDPSLKNGSGTNNASSETSQTGAEHGHSHHHGHEHPHHHDHPHSHTETKVGGVGHEHT